MLQDGVLDTIRSSEMRLIGGRTKLSSMSLLHHSSTNSAYSTATLSPSFPRSRIAPESCSFATFRASIKSSPASSGVRCRVADNLIAAGSDGRVDCSKEKR